MGGTTYLMYFVTITIVTVISTIIISLKGYNRKRYKYMPSTIVFVGGVIYCIVITFIDYNRYIGIVYVGAFLTVLPAIFLSLVTASMFDLVRFISGKSSNTKQ